MSYFLSLGHNSDRSRINPNNIWSLRKECIKRFPFLVYKQHNANCVQVIWHSNCRNFHEIRHINKRLWELWHHWVTHRVFHLLSHFSDSVSASMNSPVRPLLISSSMNHPKQAKTIDIVNFIHNYLCTISKIFNKKVFSPRIPISPMVASSMWLGFPINQQTFNIFDRCAKQ